MELQRGAAQAMNFACFEWSRFACFE